MKKPARNLDWLKPLSLPIEYRRKTFTISPRRQMSFAFMLNVLSLALPVMMLQVYDRIIPHKSYGTLTLLVAGVIIALALDATLRVMRSWLVGWTAASNEHAANCAALDYMGRTDIRHMTAISDGEYLHNFNALSRLREFYSGQAFIALIDLPFAILFLCLVAYLGGILVLVPVLILSMFLMIAGFVSARLRRALERRMMSDEKKASTVVSILTGIHTVKSLGLEESLLRRYEHAQGEVTHDSFRVAMASGMASTLGAIFGQLALILTASAGCLLVVNGQLSVGGLSACTLLAGRAIQPVQRVLGTWLRLQDLSLAKRQAQMLFAAPARPKSQALDKIGSAAITLENVSFSYDGNAPLFANISMIVPEGRCVAVTGGKSSGKSTLLQLMAGALSPDTGTVRIGDTDPGHYNLSDLQRHVGYLPQQGAIFRGTILENLTGFRDDDASVNAAKIAAADLGLDTVIDSLPYGYQTPLTDTVSDPIPPGIKQRVALARILMRRPAILLFDDADRALDKEGYNRLFRAMGRLKSFSTMVLVSHDRNLLSFADEEYRLENGILQKISSAQGFSMPSFLKGEF